MTTLSKSIVFPIVSRIFRCTRDASKGTGRDRFGGSAPEDQSVPPDVLGGMEISKFLLLDASVPSHNRTNESVALDCAAWCGWWRCQCVGSRPFQIRSGTQSRTHPKRRYHGRPRGTILEEDFENHRNWFVFRTMCRRLISQSITLWECRDIRRSFQDPLGRVPSKVPRPKSPRSPFLRGLYDSDDST